MTRVRVRAGGSAYTVFIGRGTIHKAARLIRGICPAKSIFVCSSPPVRRLYGSRLGGSLKSAGYRVRWIDLPDGEKAKTLAVLERTLRRLVRLGAGRDSCIVALGGGTVGDAAGFAASVFMRGIPFVQVPTTLVGQVDSAIGGKTGIDLPEGKNLAGTFYQPSAVISDTKVLSTLPSRQLKAGLAEVVKHGVIMSPRFFRWLERNAEKLRRGDEAALERAVIESSRMKARVVSRDEREAGLREILNFGHTFAHGFEAAAGYRGLLHGEAVAAGMVIAARLSVRRKMASESTALRIEGLLRKLGLSLAAVKRTNSRRVLRAMETDKKRRRGVSRLVLTRKIGGVTVIGNVSRKEILCALSRTGGTF